MVIPLVLVLAVVSAGLVARSSWSPDEVTRRVEAAVGGTVELDGARLTIEPGDLSGDAEVTVARGQAPDRTPGRSTPGISSSIGAPFRFEVSGAVIEDALTLEVPYTTTLEPDAAFLAYYDEERSAWRPFTATVDRTHRTLTAKVTHLSWWDPRTWDWNEISGWTGRFFGVRTNRPPCDGDPPPWVEEIVPDHDPLNPLLTCAQAVDADADRLLLRVANNRPFSVVIEPSLDYDLVEPPAAGSLYDFVFQRLRAAVSGNEVFLPRTSQGAVAFSRGDWSVAELPGRPSGASLMADAVIFVLEAIGPGELDVAEQLLTCGLAANHFFIDDELSESTANEIFAYIGACARELAESGLVGGALRSALANVGQAMRVKELAELGVVASDLWLDSETEALRTIRVYANGRETGLVVQDPVLTDGRHFGFITGVDVRLRTIDFDWAEYITEADAARAAMEADDLDPDYGGPLDYVRNRSTKIHTLPFAEDAPLSVIAYAGGCPAGRTCWGDPGVPSMAVNVEEFAERVRGHVEGTGHALPCWIEIEQGMVRSIDEQFST